MKSPSAGIIQTGSSGRDVTRLLSARQKQAPRVRLYGIPRRSAIVDTFCLVMLRSKLQFTPQGATSPSVLPLTWTGKQEGGYCPLSDHPTVQNLKSRPPETKKWTRLRLLHDGLDEIAAFARSDRAKLEISSTLPPCVDEIAAFARSRGRLARCAPGTASHTAEPRAIIVGGVNCSTVSDAREVPGWVVTCNPRQAGIMSQIG